MNLRREDRFLKWVGSDFLMHRDPNSPMFMGENKAQTMKWNRLIDIACFLLKYPKVSIPDLRKRVALTYFVNMRTALDYINYAKMIIEEWHKREKIQKALRKND